MDTAVGNFAGAASGFAELVGHVPSGAWDRPGLGEWSVRDLVGHASRSLSTVEAYLAGDATGEWLDGPEEYFLAIRGALADAGAVARRGREAGTALGDDPAAAVAKLAHRVSALVRATPEGAPVATPFGAMTLAGYLPTRSFELAVHGLDLGRALDLEVPAGLSPAIAASLKLAAAVGGRLASAGDLLLLVTGRRGLPNGLSVL